MLSWNYFNWFIIWNRVFPWSTSWLTKYEKYDNLWLDVNSKVPDERPLEIYYQNKKDVHTRFNVDVGFEQLEHLETCVDERIVVFVEFSLFFIWTFVIPTSLRNGYWEFYYFHHLKKVSVFYQMNWM